MVINLLSLLFIFPHFFIFHLSLFYFHLLGHKREAVLQHAFHLSTIIYQKFYNKVDIQLGIFQYSTNLFLQKYIVVILLVRSNKLGGAANPISNLNFQDGPV